MSLSKIGNYIQYFLKVTSGLSILITLLFLIFSDQLIVFLVGDKSYQTIFIILLLSIPLLVAYSVVESIYRGMSKINVIVRITVITSFSSILILLPLIYYFNVTGVALYLLLTPLIPLIISGLLYRKLIFQFFKSLKTKLNKSDKSSIYKIGIVSIASAILQQGAMIVLRKIIISDLGLESNGIYQSVLSLSMSAFTLVYIFLTNYTLPKLSELQLNTEISLELNNNLRFLLLLLVPIVIIVFTFKSYFIIILYSNSFSAASELFTFQLIGDIFRAFAALFGLWLIPKMKIKQLLLIDFIFNTTFILLPFLSLYIFKLGIHIIPVCYMIAFFIHFTLYLLYSKKEISFKFSDIVLINLVYSGIAILLSFYFSIYFPVVSMFINIILLGIWTYFVLSSDERNKLLNYVWSRKK